MKRLHAHVGSRYAALEQAPEVLKSISVYTAIYVLYGVVNNLVRIIAGESIIRFQGIGVESRSSFNVPVDFRLQFLFLASRYHLGPNLPAALQHSHNGGLFFCSAAIETAAARA